MLPSSTFVHRRTETTARRCLKKLKLVFLFLAKLIFKKYCSSFPIFCTLKCHLNPSIIKSCHSNSWTMPVRSPSPSHQSFYNQYLLITRLPLYGFKNYGLAPLRPPQPLLLGDTRAQPGWGGRGDSAVLEMLWRSALVQSQPYFGGFFGFFLGQSLTNPPWFSPFQDMIISASWRHNLWLMTYFIFISQLL